MTYLVIFIIVILLAISLFKFLFSLLGKVLGFILDLIRKALFKPAFNSAIWLILCASASGLGILAYHDYRITLLFLLPIPDCINDIVRANELYVPWGRDDHPQPDSTYILKSLLCIPTLGLIRILYFFIIEPYLSFTMKRGAKKLIRKGYPVAKNICPGKRFKTMRLYYWQKTLKKMEESGLIVSNEDTVKKETERQREKFYKHPREERYDLPAFDVLVRDNVIPSFIAYIGADAYERLPGVIMEGMSRRGTLPVSEIKKLDGMEVLFGRNTGWADEVNWSDYFIIQALEPYVEDGTFEDSDYNDIDPLDTHAYRYVKSSKKMKSIKADSDPRFALD